MDNYAVLVSASRYLNVVYNFEVFSDDENAAWKLRSYVKLLNEDPVLADYWEMFKSTRRQEKAMNSEQAAIKDDFSLWDANSNNANDHPDNDYNTNVSNADNLNLKPLGSLNEPEITDHNKPTRIVLPKGL